MVKIHFDPYIFEPYIFEPFTDFYRFDHKEHMKGKLIARFRMGLQERQIEYQYQLRDVQRDYQTDLADMNKSLYDELGELG